MVKIHHEPKKEKQTMEVRPMTEQDIDAAASVHLRAFKGYMNASLGRNYVRKFLNWFRTSPIGIALVVADAGKPIGYVVGARLGYDADLNKALLKTGIKAILSHPNILFHSHFLGTIASRLKLLLNKKKASVKVNKEPTGIGVSLVGIAVDPANSKKGGGSMLMQSFEQKARELGYNYMRLSVYEENKTARQLYSKSGWQPLEIESPVIYYYKEISQIINR